jgi:predicted permease
VAIFLFLVGAAFAVVAAFLIFVGYIGEDLTSYGWKIVAICGGFALASWAGATLVLLGERYRSRS